MLWQFRQDFCSLFIRNNDNQNYFQPLDGLRSIANLSIILLHLITILTALRSPYPAIEWQEFLNSMAFALNNILSLTLEIFFLLSGFLLTHKLINRWNKNSAHFELFLWNEYPMLILRRALRFWPGMLLTIPLMIIFSEPVYFDSCYFLEFFRHLSTWMFFQNYISLRYWFASSGHLWTNSLDMQIYMTLPLLLYFFYSYRKFISIYNCLVILLLISIIRGIVIFDPMTMSPFELMCRYPAVLLLSGNHVAGWIERTYNVSFSYDIPEANEAKLFMAKMYFPFDARFGSFVIGSILAIKLTEGSSHNGRPATFKKTFFFILICFQMFMMILSPDFSPPPDLVMTLAVATSRQLFTIGQAFILFTALCSTSHPYHSPWIKKFLSSSIWIPVSKLSYLVYVVHWRISLELIFAGPLRFLKTYPITQALLISLPIVLLVTQFISCIWYILVEKPIERSLKYYFEKKLNSKTD